jgi:hypothetical protein
VKSASFYVKGLILEKIFFVTEVRQKMSKLIFCGEAGTGKTSDSPILIIILQFSA